MRFAKIAEYFGVCNTTIKNLKRGLEVGEVSTFKYQSNKNNLTGIVKVERIF